MKFLLDMGLARSTVDFLRRQGYDAPVMDKLAQVRTALQRIYPLDLLDQLAARIYSSLSDVDLLAFMRVKEIQVAYDQNVVPPSRLPT